ncbi:MAG TPA: hypothetical protein VG057_15545 [Solirubrobacteraceae bacterium]|jgi:hypothetical protein|nr:hypothetical protein [Solirubrobacteraceae bacterium]
MTTTQEMLDTVPTGVLLGSEDVAAAIDACLRCTQSCTTCADADLVEDDFDEMRECIALCLNCADVCALTARLLSRPAHSDEYVIHRVLDACVRVCTACAEECHRHAHHHRHCALSETVCRECIRACQALLDTKTFADIQRLAAS